MFTVRSMLIEQGLFMPNKSWMVCPGWSLQSKMHTNSCYIFPEPLVTALCHEACLVNFLLASSVFYFRESPPGALEQVRGILLARRGEALLDVISHFPLNMPPDHSIKSIKMHDKICSIFFEDL